MSPRGFEDTSSLSSWVDGTERVDPVVVEVKMNAVWWKAAGAIVWSRGVAVLKAQKKDCPDFSTCFKLKQIQKVGLILPWYI